MARSTFRSQNVQNTTRSDHFWKLRCRKSAGRCGAKHISKSKCTKHTRFGALLEVAMSKKCRPLGRKEGRKEGREGGRKEGMNRREGRKGGREGGRNEQEGRKE